MPTSSDQKAWPSKLTTCASLNSNSIQQLGREYKWLMRLELAKENENERQQSERERDESELEQRRERCEKSASLSSVSSERPSEQN